MTGVMKLTKYQDNGTELFFDENDGTQSDRSEIDNREFQVFGLCNKLQHDILRVDS